MTRDVTCTAAAVLETYGDFNFSAFPSCVALSNTRFFATASYIDGGSSYPTPPPFDSTIGLWLLDASATILDSTRVTTSDGAYLPCGPMQTSPTTTVMAVDSDPGSVTTTRSIVGLDLSGDTITVSYQTTPESIPAAYPGDGWISSDGMFCIARDTGGDFETPVTHDIYDPTDGTHIGSAPYAPNRTPQLVDQLNFIDFPAEEYGPALRTRYSIDLPPYGIGSAPGDSFYLPEDFYQPVGGGVGGVSGRGAGSVQGYVGINYPRGRGILCGIEYYAVSGLIAAIVPGAVTPPLRKIQRSDGLAMGAPRRVQTSTIQSSNRRFGII